MVRNTSKVSWKVQFPPEVDGSKTSGKSAASIALSCVVHKSSSRRGSARHWPLYGGDGWPSTMGMANIMVEGKTDEARSKEAFQNPTMGIKPLIEKRMRMEPRAWSHVGDPSVREIGWARRLFLRLVKDSSSKVRRENNSSDNSRSSASNNHGLNVTRESRGVQQLLCPLCLLSGDFFSYVFSTIKTSCTSRRGACSDFSLQRWVYLAIATCLVVQAV